MKLVSDEQVTLLLPSFLAAGSEQANTTIVSGSTGNCVVVCIVIVHSVFSPVHFPGKLRILIDMVNPFIGNIRS